MRDFIQKNFPELLIMSIIVCLVIVILASVHWHDNTTIGWAEKAIDGILMGLMGILNSLRVPHPSIPNTTVTSTESVKVTDPNAKEKS